MDRDSIIESVAFTLALSAYADAFERAEDRDEPEDHEPEPIPEGFQRPGAGEDWADYLPSVPGKAKSLAHRIVEDIERQGPIEAWADAWALSAGAETERERRRFGHCLAMQALGHGVGLNDDTGPGYKRPEVGLYELCLDLEDFLPT